MAKRPDLAARTYPEGRHTFRTYTSKRLVYALCKPTGRPHCVADSFEQALGEYVDMRKGVILDDKTQLAWFEKLKGKGWTIRHIETKVTLGQEIREIPDDAKENPPQKRNAKRRPKGKA